MKRKSYSKLALTLLCIILLISMGAIFASAENTQYSQNLTQAKIERDLLHEIQSNYTSKALNSGLPIKVASSVNAIIGEYDSKISAALNSPENINEDLSAAFATLRVQAIRAGELAWIVFSHSERELHSLYKESINEDTLINDKVYSEFLKYKAEIDLCESEEYAKLFSERDRKALLKFVFQDNLDILRTNGTESYGIKQRINTDELLINALDASDIDAQEYYDIYNKTVAFVTVRRAYASADKELKQVATALGSAENSKPITDFANMVETLNTSDEVNIALGNAVSSLINIRIPESEGFIGALKNELILECASKVEDACEKGLDALGNAVIADLSAILEELDLREYRARAKDRIDILVPILERDSIQRNIIKSYVDDGAILDECTDKKYIDIEVFRATTRIELYDFYITEYEIIENALLQINNKEILESAKNAYAAADSAIVELNRDTPEANKICERLAENSRAEIKELSYQAKAQKYLHEHYEILNQITPETISTAHRAALEATIDSYSSLDNEVKRYLNDAKIDLNKKYKAITVIEIKASVNETNEYALSLISSTNTLSNDLSPDILRAQANENVLRAKTLGILFEKYAAMTADALYASYDDYTKSALAEDISNASNTVLNSEATAEKTLSSLLDDIYTNAELDMERHASIGKVRIEAKDSELEEIKRTVASAELLILESGSIREVHAVRDSAIFRISCQRKADQMKASITDIKSKIDAFDTLDASKKATLKREADALIDDCNAAAEAVDKNALDIAVRTFETKLAALAEKAEAQALLEGKRLAISDIEEGIRSVKNQLNEYDFINYEKGDTSKILNTELDTLLSEFEINVNKSTVAWQELNDLKASALENIKKILKNAENTNFSGAQASVRDTVNGAFSYLERYSDTNKPKIESILETALNDIDSALSVDELLEIRNTAISEIENIPSILDEAKSRALEKLNEVFEALKVDMYCYAESVWAEIQQIFDHTSAEIGLISDFDELERVDSIANERCAIMKDKKRDTLYTSDKLLVNGTSEYPSGYDPVTNGYAGSLYANGQLPSDATFNISPFSSPSAEDIIRKAVKGKRISLPQSVSHGSSLLSALKGCNVLSGINISYSAYTENTLGTYTVTLLLPDSIDAEDLLGAVYIRDDGSIEFFECSMRGNLVTFDVPHFSSFYLVEERTVNLTPLIIILSVFFIIEIAAIAFLTIRRSSREKKITAAAVFPIPFLTKLIPSGAITISVILAFLVVFAGGAIFYLSLDELKHRSLIKKRTLPIVQKEAKKALKKETAKELSLAFIDEQSHNLTTAAPTTLPTKTEDTEKTDLQLPILDTVSADEADDLMSDVEARSAIEAVSSSELPPAVYSSHGKKYEVNIDAISDSFEAEETVSLDSLKQKGLVPKSARAVKILARGSLNKPLTVIAQDFSTSAVKMITLTGGHAMLVERE